MKEKKKAAASGERVGDLTQEEPDYPSGNANALMDLQQMELESAFMVGPKGATVRLSAKGSDRNVGLLILIVVFASCVAGLTGGWLCLMADAPGWMTGTFGGLAMVGTAGLSLSLLRRRGGKPG
ncbi:hypothetical protein Amsp01_019720 [Amycolatopsis sp. NBRC 101858]|uniref:hypothetical protein n=1 Tax=Amycolatopsis sp. NBRC 101858 TaxID=3032200 RepID=UPI0024A48E8B|nr:hypothetical protein [Amycolatopsis sp. NBRC 101858]GLY35948.1 hypothetical protein Amsp01_019720 [Amycolatopsis sp. NBRC 101858]